MKWNFINAFKYFGPNPCQLLIHSSQMNLFQLFKKRTKPEPELLQWADNLAAEHNVVDWTWENTFSWRDVTEEQGWACSYGSSAWLGRAGFMSWCEHLPLSVGLFPQSKINQFLPFCTTKTFHEDVMCCHLRPYLGFGEQKLCTSSEWRIIPASQPKHG